MFVWLKTSPNSVASPQYLHRSNNQDIYCRVGVVVSGHWGGKMAQRLGDMQLADRTPFPQFPLLTYPSSFSPTTSSPTIQVPFSKEICEIRHKGKMYVGNVFDQSISPLCSNTAFFFFSSEQEESFQYSILGKTQFP
jgi:hypothetical protein